MVPEQQSVVHTADAELALRYIDGEGELQHREHGLRHLDYKWEHTCGQRRPADLVRCDVNKSNLQSEKDSCEQMRVKKTPVGQHDGNPPHNTDPQTQEL